MACACKVNRDIEMLNRRFGVERKGKKPQKPELIDILRNICLILVKILVLPFMIILFPFTVLFSVGRRRPINMSRVISKIPKFLK